MPCAVGHGMEGSAPWGMIPRAPWGRGAWGRGAVGHGMMPVGPRHAMLPCARDAWPWLREQENAMRDACRDA